MLAPHRASTSKPPARASLDTQRSAGAENDVDDEEGTAAVLPSSMELFYFYGQTLEACAMLSTGKPLFDLCGVFRKWLRVYAEEVLVANRKRSVGPMSFVRRSGSYKFPVVGRNNRDDVQQTPDSMPMTLSMHVPSSILRITVKLLHRRFASPLFCLNAVMS